jgi:hypothetical protein
MHTVDLMLTPPSVVAGATSPRVHKPAVDHKRESNEGVNTLKACHYRLQNMFVARLLRVMAYQMHAILTVLTLPEALLRQASI